MSEHESTPKAEFVLTLSCADRPGIVHAVAGALLVADCNITDSQQYGSPATGTFFMRVAVETTTAFTLLHAALDPGGADVWDELGAAYPVRGTGAHPVLASKAAHCLNDLLFLQRSGTLPIEIPAIVSNHLDLKDLADFYRMPFHHIPVTAATPRPTPRTRCAC